MSTPAIASAEPPDLPTLKGWLQDELGAEVALLGPTDRPQALGVWYPTHLQLLRTDVRHGLPIAILHTTFCALPRRRRDVLPLLAQANLQLERGRWFTQREPARLSYALELPATCLDAPKLAREWQRFRQEAVAHGIELTLRTRAVTWVELLRSRGKAPRA